MSIQVTVAEDILKKLPGIKLGVIEYTDVVISELPKMLRGRINLFLSHLRLEYGADGLTQIPGVKEWRRSFKALGIDPSKYRPSSEALLKRTLQEKPMYWINSAVDINNFLSMQFAIPFGIYNAEKMNGPVTCRIGNEGEAYEGLNGRETSMGGKLLLADSLSPFGSPIVDSVRTSIAEDATHLVQILFIYPGYPSQKLEELLQTTSSLFMQVHGGEVEEQRII